MSLLVVASGTTSALTPGTETVLTTQTPSAPTTYVTRIDGGALTSDEYLLVVVYTKDLSGGTERVEQMWKIIGGSDPVVCLTHPTPTDISYKVGITQVGGTGRTIPWKLLSL